MILFRHKARWTSSTEVVIFLLVVALIAALDVATTKFLVELGTSAAISKLLATALGLVLNFSGRRFLVFPEPSSGPWKPQED